MMPADKKLLSDSEYADTFKTIAATL